MPHPSSTLRLLAIRVSLPACSPGIQLNTSLLGLSGTVFSRYGAGTRQTEGGRDGTTQGRVRRGMAGGTERASCEGEGADPAQRRARRGAPAASAHEGREGVRVRGPAGEG